MEDEVISSMSERRVEEMGLEVGETMDVGTGDELAVILVPVVVCTEEGLGLGNVSGLAVTRAVLLVLKLGMLVEGAIALAVERGWAVKVEDGGGGDELVVMAVALMHLPV